jgi:hypothetical protein
VKTTIINLLFSLFILFPSCKTNSQSNNLSNCDNKMKLSKIDSCYFNCIVEYIKALGGWNNERDYIAMKKYPSNNDTSYLHIYYGLGLYGIIYDTLNNYNCIDHIKIFSKFEFGKKQDTSTFKKILMNFFPEDYKRFQEGNLYLERILDYPSMNCVLYKNRVIKKEIIKY